MSTNDQIRLEADSLSALKSSFPFSRRARPPPVELGDHSERTPLGQGANKLARRESRGGLRGIFGRSKSDVNLISSLPPTTEDLPVTKPRQEATAKDKKGENPLEQQQAKSPVPTPERKPGIRMTMRAKSAKTKPVPKGGSKPTPKATPNTPRRTSATWDPPPLFQAYPQAIKHAQLA